MVSYLGLHYPDRERHNLLASFEIDGFSLALGGLYVGIPQLVT